MQTTQSPSSITRIAQVTVAPLRLAERLAEQRLDLLTNGYRVIARAYRTARQPPPRLEP